MANRTGIQLTEKERAFCEALKKGAGYTEAARLAGYESVNSEVKKILRRPEVLRAALDGAKERLGRYNANAQTLMDLAKGVKSKAMTRYLEDHPDADERNAISAAKNVMDALKQAGLTLSEAAAAEDQMSNVLQIAQDILGQARAVKKAVDEGSIAPVIVPDTETQH